MKFKLSVLVALFYINNVVARDSIVTPVVLELFTYCKVDDSCHALVSIKNNLPYEVKLTSYSINNNKILASNIQVFNAEEYIERDRMQRDVYGAIVKGKIKVVRSKKKMGSLTLKPNENKYFEIINFNANYDLDKVEAYFTLMYLPHVSFYIENDFIGTRSLSSNFSEIQFPLTIDELKEARE